MAQLKVKRTTFEPKGYEGYQEPCIIVGKDDAYVRISKCHHYIGRDTLYVAEVLDGMVNSMDEIVGDYDVLSDSDARNIARRHSVYL